MLFHHVGNAPQVELAVAAAASGTAMVRHAHGAPIRAESLGGAGRVVGKQRLTARAAEVVGHGGGKQRAVGPLREHARDALRCGGHVRPGRRCSSTSQISAVSQ